MRLSDLINAGQPGDTLLQVIEARNTQAAKRNQMHASAGLTRTAIALGDVNKAKLFASFAVTCAADAGELPVDVESLCPACYAAGRPCSCPEPSDA